MVAVRDFLGVCMRLLEPVETLVRRVSRSAHLVLRYAEPEATRHAQTTLAAPVLGSADTAVEGNIAVFPSSRKEWQRMLTACHPLFLEALEHDELGLGDVIDRATQHNPETRRMISPPLAGFPREKLCLYNTGLI